MTVQRIGKLFFIEVIKNAFIREISSGIVLEVRIVFQKLVMTFKEDHSCGGVCQEELKSHGIFRKWPVERNKKG